MRALGRSPGAGLPLDSESIVCSLIGFLLCRKLFAVVTFITPLRKNSKRNLRRLDADYG